VDERSSATREWCKRFISRSQRQPLILSPIQTILYRVVFLHWHRWGMALAFCYIQRQRIPVGAYLRHPKMARALAIESLVSQFCASIPNEISYHENLLSNDVHILPFLQTSLETFDSPKTTRATKKSPCHFLSLSIHDFIIAYL
jgi:hypothetical protein